MTSGEVDRGIIGSDTSHWSVIHRVIFPQRSDRDALVLYVDPEHSGAVSAWARHSVVLQAGAPTSFCSYFAAVPVAYWRQNTTVICMRLALELSDEAEVTVWCSDAQGRVRSLHEPVTADGRVSIVVELPTHTDGGWMWFDVSPVGRETTMSNASWSAPSPTRHSRVTVCVTTMDRAADVVALLSAIADDPAVGQRLDALVVVDQGAQPVQEHPDFEAAAASLTAPVRVIRQRNLGGSGGFSRGMIEGLAGGSDHVMLLDDDVVLETESILRALAFADHSRNATIVGAQMLSLVDRSLLHSVGERIEQNNFWWGPVDSSVAPVDLAIRTLRSTPALHRRVDVDFNGWWMCLIPTSVLRQAGLSLPFFIKWDDAEFGLRSAALHVTTVSLPGVALWHMPWTAKDDGLDWQAYFQLRNRLVTALLHTRHARGGRLPVMSLAQDLNHVLCMQYGSVALRNAAIQDVLSGPEHLWKTLATGRARAQAILLDEGQAVVSLQDLPAVIQYGNTVQTRPTHAAKSAVRLLRAAIHQLSQPRIAASLQARVDRADGKWWLLGLLDSAAVSSATGKGSFVVRRSRIRAWSLSRDAMSLRIRLVIAWPRLARDYRASAASLSSPESWQSFIDVEAAPR